MASPFLGQLLIVGFDFAPTGWALAAGQLIPISQNTALFSLLGTQFGGDGKSNFALPNMQGMISNGQGNGPGLQPYFVGQTGGTPTVILSGPQFPAHTHNATAASSPRLQGQVTNPAGATLASAPAGSNVYAPGNSSLNQKLGLNAVSVSGEGRQHNNMMPFQCLNWIIAFQGVFPPRN